MYNTKKIQVNCVFLLVVPIKKTHNFLASLSSCNYRMLKRRNVLICVSVVTIFSASPSSCNYRILKRRDVLICVSVVSSMCYI